MFELHLMTVWTSSMTKGSCVRFSESDVDTSVLTSVCLCLA